MWQNILVLWWLKRSARHLFLVMRCLERAGYVPVDLAQDFRRICTSIAAKVQQSGDGLFASPSYMRWHPCVLLIPRWRDAWVWGFALRRWNSRPGMDAGWWEYKRVDQ